MSCLHQLKELLDGQIDDIPRCRLCRIHKREGRMETPEHFWSLGIPDTQQCKARGRSTSYRLTISIKRPKHSQSVVFLLGYVTEEATKPSKSRRRRPLKMLDVDKAWNRVMSKPSKCSFQINWLTTIQWGLRNQTYIPDFLVYSYSHLHYFFTIVLHFLS